MNNTTKGTMYLLVGAYIIYMGIKMYRNTAGGLSSMSMTTTVLLMICMVVAGGFVLFYSAALIYKDYKNQIKRQEEIADKEKGSEE